MDKWVHGNEALPDGDPLVRSEIMIRASQRRRIKAAGINLSQQVREWIDRDFHDIAQVHKDLTIGVEAERWYTTLNESGTGEDY
ncbi:MAG: hypothetical protein M0R06_00835 [Sphaerochaeta sp.]|jgi:hypothetical protein|nr:hypothetical protein [Sphaerochaeta sp.]